MSWLLASILIPFIAALGCLACGSRPAMARALGVAGAAAMLGASIGLMREVLAAGHVAIQAGEWPAPIGITLIADIFSASMVCITAVIGLAAAVYSLRDVSLVLVRKHYFALFHFLLMGVNGAFITGDLFNMYVWFEVMLISSFVLITLGGKREQVEGGLKYLVINLVSSLLFLSGIGLLYGQVGTLNMADLSVTLAASGDARLVNGSAMLILVAFGIKAALFPFFFWLPASYHTPPFAVSALFAGLLTKVGVYALIRSYTLIFRTEFAATQDILVFLAGATMVTGVLGAASHFEIRRILSFHIVSQIGYILMGLAIGTPLALAGAVFYTLHHIIVKANLFLIAGLVHRKCGSCKLKEIGGLYRWAPGLSLLFFIPAFSLGGIPPLSGFWAKFAVIRAGLEAGHYILVGTALLVGVMTLFSMTKIWAEAFWKPMPPGKGGEGEGRIRRVRLAPSLVVPCVILAVMTAAIGLWSEPLFELARGAGDQLVDPRPYIETVLGK